MPDQYQLDYAYGEFRESHQLTDGHLVEISAKNEVTMAAKGNATNAKP